MSHITVSPLRKPLRFFGQDCLAEKMAVQSAENMRLQTENDILRKEIESWKRQVREGVQSEMSLAIKLANAQEQIMAMGIGMAGLQDRLDIAEAAAKGDKE